MKPRTESLVATRSPLQQPKVQIDLLDSTTIPAFDDTLKATGTQKLDAVSPGILQVNLGYMCNQRCAHCHVDAGPERREIMTRTTMNQCLEALDKGSFETVDLTGGAPEMNPSFRWFVKAIRNADHNIIVRSNLTILVSNPVYDDYPAFYRDNGVTVIASLPCYTAENTDKQRGDGVFDASIRALKKLNDIGYGKGDSGLELHLVFNPQGASVAPSQEALESDYKRVLKNEYGIVFNHLYTITNLPVSRYLHFLEESGQLEEYMALLHKSFNPQTVESLMCRNTISVDWQGNLYDCDFNQMLHHPVQGEIRHIRNFDAGRLSGREICTGKHCYGCTAGAGSSCQGALT